MNSEAYSSSSINIDNKEKARQKFYSSNQTNNTEQILSTTNDLSTDNDEEESENNDDDCLIKFGLISSSKTQLEENQPEQLVEEINAITAFIIYNTYSQKHASTSKIKNLISSNSIRNDIDRFDSIYSCLIDNNKQSISLNNSLRNRFLNLSDINKLKTFQKTEQLRIKKEKKYQF